MLLSVMKTEILDALDRDASIFLLTKTLFWIQNAIDLSYAAMSNRERQRTETLTTVIGQQYLNTPEDYADVVEIKNSDNQSLNYQKPKEFTKRNLSDTATGTPRDFTFFNGQFLFNPIPDAVASYTLLYKIDRPNIFIHELFLEHKASMAGFVQVYIDEDGFNSGQGKLLCISPTTEDIKVLIQAVDGHKHELIIYHDADPSSHPKWYFDETTPENFFLSPTANETVIKTETYRGHHHYLKFVHSPDPTSFPDANNALVFVDDDDVDREKRLKFTSPLTTDSAHEIIHARQGEFPGLLERLQFAVYQFALAEGYMYNKNPELAKGAREAGKDLLVLSTGNPEKTEKGARE